MSNDASAVLVLGTSHVGKSSCARELSNVIGWPVISTDKLGRHPGRPWTNVPAPVTEFYLNLSDEAIHWFLRVHHENMHPVIRAAIQDARRRGAFILEGAALRPEYLVDWGVGDALVICLHADESILRERISAGSRYSEQPKETKLAIDMFIERSLRENVALVEAAKQHGLKLIDVSTSESEYSIARQMETLLAKRKARLAEESRSELL
jgi:2-phosphoglycerate kinase